MADWHKYYGGADNTAGQATINPSDVLHYNFEKMSPEANFVVYYGNWRRPSNGDAWTNAGCNSIWVGINGSGFNTQLSEDTTNHIVGTSSLKATCTAVGGAQSGIYIPNGKQAAWDFSGFTDFNVPTMNFYIRAHGTISNISVGVYNIASDGSTIDAYGTSNLSTDVTEYDKWYHFSLPLGPYYNTPERFQTFKWYGTGTLDWSAIDAIQFWWTAGQNSYVNLDGFYFGDAAVCRVAYNSDKPGGVVKERLIVDNIGKDDSLKASDDSGLMAKMAYAELLRLQSDALVGTLQTPMIKDALPGQLLDSQGTPFRITQIVQSADASTGFLSTFHVTDDVLNGRARARYEDINKQFANLRPAWQDRNSSSQLAGSVDWRIARLAKDYA